MGREGVSKRSDGEEAEACCLTTRWSGRARIVGRVWPQHGHRGRQLNAIVRARRRLCGARRLSLRLSPISNRGPSGARGVLSLLPVPKGARRGVLRECTGTCGLSDNRVWRGPNLRVRVLTRPSKVLLRQLWVAVV